MLDPLLLFQVSDFVTHENILQCSTENVNASQTNLRNLCTKFKDYLY